MIESLRSMAICRVSDNMAHRASAGTAYFRRIMGLAGSRLSRRVDPRLIPSAAVHGSGAPATTGASRGRGRFSVFARKPPTGRIEIRPGRSRVRTMRRQQGGRTRRGRAGVRPSVFTTECCSSGDERRRESFSRCHFKQQSRDYPSPFPRSSRAWISSHPRGLRRIS